MGIFSNNTDELETFKFKSQLAYNTYNATLLNAIAKKVGVNPKFIRDCYKDLEEHLTK